MVSVTIDGRTVSVPKGSTILEAARQLGIAIPTLCWLEKVSPTGACRICVVEVQGVARPMTACNTPVKDGIVVTTQSEQITTIRRQVMELMLVNHPLDCPVCDAGGECDLQDSCYALNVTKQPFRAEDVNPGPIDKWPLIQQVPSRCILCEKCVKVCHEVVGSSSLFINDKGDRSYIDKHLELCEFCGNCVSVCPTGTMISKLFKFRARPWELRKTRSLCNACGSQCDIDIHVKNNEIYRVTSEDGTTVNNGNLCIGGFFGYGYVNSNQRLKSPLVNRGGQLMPADWDEALGLVADRARALSAAHGADTLAALASPRLTNEENYLFQKLFRAGLGCNNIDSEARFSALRALLPLSASLGLHGASNRLDRIGQSDAVLVFGSDVTAEAPAIDWQIELACRKRDGKLVVANMRRVKLTRWANTHLGYRPGSEVFLATALARLILDKGLADQAFMEKYLANPEALTKDLAQVDLARAVKETGVPLALLEEAAEHLGRAESVAVIFGADVTRGSAAADKAQAIANLALVCGALHGDLGGLFPVDEKGNTQGLLDMGACPEFLPGFADYAKNKARFEQLWSCKLPEGGRNAEQILDGIEKGEVRFLYLAATNPLISFPDSRRWRRALERLDLLVVQDILPSEVTRLAHVVLPGASFAEKSGSLTSLDHRVNCLRPALKSPGKARVDWDIFADLYQRLRPAGGRPDAAALLDEIKAATPLYSEVCLPAQDLCRPCVKPLFAPALKSLRYVPVQAQGASEGLQLLTGKMLFHFGTTTTFAEGTLEVAPEGYIEINPRDAAKLGVDSGGALRVASAIGSAQAKVKISENVPDGLLFAPYHFSDVNINQIMPMAVNLVKVDAAKA
ncbi:molybdopterin-dependent oxidoreductase [Geoalkalibacter sp.]|uniref:molybdopterin-dependent oxidoreductase n=1 Tax=Geoalkalibacter sp. TaxID=3041440 RepID=UPI00272E02AD|nr:molybdopterin-dependent oxidoreductase [Geoalkalibacter sp.]